MKIKPFNNRSGFTLIELVIAVTIIALLAVISLTVFTGVQRTARDAKRRADISAISQAFEDNYNFFAGNHYRPLQGTDFASGQIPADPISTRSYSGTGAFSIPLGGPEFCICAHLELANGNSDHDATSGNCSTSASGASANYYCLKNRR